MDAEQVSFPLSQEPRSACLGVIFITTLHRLGTSADSSCHFLLAMELYVGIVLKDSLPHVLEIMYIRGNTKACFCGGTFWKDINHRTNQNKTLAQKNKASPLSPHLTRLILIYKNQTKKQVYNAKLLLLIPYFSPL